MNSSFYNKIELLFWDLAINLLTRSVWLRSLIQRAALLRRSSELRSSIFIVLFSGLFGFFVGFSLPYFFHLIR